MNTFVTPVWVLRESLTWYFKSLGFGADFILRVQNMSDAEIERLNTRVCKALAAIYFYDVEGP